jgi:hypothetical protein
VPWFSGICLEGEVAGQYEIERSGSKQEHQDPTKAGLLELDGLAPITIFVGANNSGKSRLMRELFGNSEAAKYIRIGLDSKELESERSNFLALIQRLKTFDDSGESGLVEIVPVMEKFLADYRNWTDKVVHGWTGVHAMSLLDAINSRIESLLQNRAELKARSYVAFWPGFYRPLWQSQLSKRMRYLSLRRCYVPMLRGMRPPLAPVVSDQQSVSASDCFEERSILDYFSGLPNWRNQKAIKYPFGTEVYKNEGTFFSEKPRIFTGLSLYCDIRKRLLAPTYEERKSIRDYEIFLSVNFFQGREVTLTPAMHNQEGKENDVVHIKIGDNEDRPIYALGDGMQSLIICTYPIITELQRGSLFFLEEPDLCMHPSLQRVFLKVLRDSYIEKGHQFFLTTHSNHLLDLLEDDDLVSIFSFSEITDPAPDPDAPSEADNMANPQSTQPAQRFFRIRPSNLRDRQTLLELGVRPSATYLANATVWVEGVSDYAYLRAYMEAFVHYLKVRGNDWGKNSMNGKSLAQRLEEYKEDRHYAFVEYSGANLTHFSFGDADCDEGQGQATSSIVTNVPYLCSKAIVIADGDITDSNKGDRWKLFANQLDERFIRLPCKEIENLIPDELMKSQIREDDSNIDVTKLTEVKYADYRKLKIGLGDYLSNFDFVTKLYAGKSGTLTAYRKKMWSSNDKGIPWLVRQAIERDIKRIKDGTGNPENTGNTQSNAEAVAIPELPSYLTQDLIWLSVCLYTHIAECNHDTITKKELKVFQEFIKRQGVVPQAPAVVQAGDSQPCPESDNTAESAALEWPIKEVDRSCLLTAFLRESNKPE